MGRIATPTTSVVVAGRTEKRLRELDRKSAAAAASAGALGLRARHSWTGSGSVAPGSAWTQLTTWTATRDDGVAIHDGAGTFTLIPGAWFMQLIVYSDAGAAGNFGLRLSNVPDIGDLRSTGYTGAGFAGAGYDDREVSWTGPVAGAEAGNPINAWTRWLVASGTTARTITCRLNLHLLGGETA